MLNNTGEDKPRHYTPRRETTPRQAGMNPATTPPTVGAGLVPALFIPRFIRHIDKRKLAVIIKLNYFGKFLNLPIDKIAI